MQSLERDVNFGVPYSPMSSEPQQDGLAGQMSGLYASRQKRPRGDAIAIEQSSTKR
jgi:hypothetical protein